ncbi:MAG: ATP-dependent zinc metalloprotease FtsH [Candidatus Aminicenantes bacterium]|nr:ATP-dependent zinc metalloprotease FtsH [Candidatus Aminicenantes bacterium]
MDKKRKKPKTYKNLIFWILTGVVIIVLWSLLQTPGTAKNEVSFSQFLNDVENERVEEVTITGNQITGKYLDQTEFKTVSPDQFDGLVPILRDYNVNINVKDDTKNPWYSYLFTWFPIILIVLFWVFFMRQMQSGGNKALSFGKSKAKLFTGPKKKVTFKDVAGVKEAKEELKEIIAFLKDPKKFQKLGGRIPKGVILVGAPGTGKTLLARAVAGEANVSFFSISGSDFVEMFVGVGASRVRDLFEQGKKQAPCLIFIDELDAVGRHRGAGLGGGHDEREQTLNQLLVEMDGFNANEGIILIAATNRPDILDNALLRPGRFDRRIVVNMPDVKGREDILRVHVKNIPMSDDVDLSVLARSTPGFSGADLANLVNESALLAARFNKEEVSMKDLETSKDKVLMGVERKSMIISDDEKKTTAFHEAGHALIAFLIPEADPLHKVTIIPRGRALGLTQQLPLDDRYTYSKEYLEAQLSVLMAGRAAENMFLNRTTTGAANDFEKSTEIARKMVCEYGMSDLGPLTFGEKDDMVFLGKELSTHRNFSEKTAQLIDAEVKKIVERNLDRTINLLQKHKKELQEIAKALLNKEVLSSKEIETILNGKRPKKTKKASPSKNKKQNKSSAKSKRKAST